ncbi:hypothetical protein N7448_008456 [Penicillium atrosanguineum]|uniref:Uncharacterized protein n=1 Tax=Penicillium atrosanguineum TaxID=1132637 RepID=A0A9W9GR76_9EURO|nr:uncharacterized protein N7443_000529 [Penicillium atrosanguineum]KAJ5127677.1 hypothetical protein N7448_008456 [Penicillium atrosanguineum]KAJ5147886.1 hypothetical protein N7526_001238 [Penicillium atrosanguineum]KAJ5313645.1 hypothetical protein N7443_000529 [Penicillium atrosanguineum]KAJ5330817.1 hypothetical protein N7476_000600 [Penicillium atrosanguineum]
MASESDGADVWSLSASADDYISSRPQIQVLNVETPKERFPNSEDIRPPDVATWRCNLTALSQRRNLLFVASGSSIHVWVPSGPFQMLGSRPEMIIDPVMKMPRAEGYIDRNNPHTINAILVDDLGRDEVLLLVTDSGNVCGYRVEAIYSCLARCKEEGIKRPFDGAQVSPFFTEEVGMSAWGLATHKFARLIAVSSNTGQITVYAFALVNQTPDGDDMQGCSLTSDQTWVSINNRKQLRELQKLMPYNHRSRNLRLTYRGHFDNIPCVSFANFDLDANGIWMVSTDISNRVIIWRVWDDLWPCRVYFPGHTSNNPPQRGWTVLPLDPRTFKHYQTREEACGTKPRFELDGLRTILDVSKAIREVKDASQLIDETENRNQTKPINNHCLPDDIFSSECCIDEDRFSSPAGLGHDFRPASEHDQENDSGGRLSPDLSTRSESAEFWSSAPPRIQSRPRTKPLLASLFEEDNPHSRVEPRLVYKPSREDLTDSFDNFHVTPVHPPSSGFYPVIHFSETTIALAPYPMHSEYHLICKSPLLQKFQSWDISRHCDRFNMVKYIPELGIVVAASQKGRLAIITLTWQREIGFAFRLDWIVPFYTQELNDERPESPLLGIAVSPMAGSEIPQDVPCIPQGVDPNDWLKFHYRILNPDDNEDSSSASPSRSSSPAHNETTHSASTPRAYFDTTSQFTSYAEGNEFEKPETHTQNLPSISDATLREHNTLPEIHAEAFRAYRPHENWHGSHPSRHYRLLLMFYDHTVMSYEFWHDWEIKAPAEE